MAQFNVETQMKLTIKLKHSVDRLVLLRWIRNAHTQWRRVIALSKCMELANSLIAGTEWVPDERLIGTIYHFRENIPDFIDANFVIPVDPDIEYRQNVARLYSLLEKGAAGDTEAAIAYCKAELAGEVNHSGYAG